MTSKAERQFQRATDALRDLIEALEEARFAEEPEMQAFALTVAAALEQSAQVIREMNKPRPH